MQPRARTVRRRRMMDEDHSRRRLTLFTVYLWFPVGALVFPPAIVCVVGIVMGIVLIVRGRRGHGIASLLLSLAFGIAKAAISAHRWSP
jgi:hypothetical protein